MMSMMGNSDLPVRYRNVIIPCLDIVSGRKAIQLRLQEADLILRAAAADIYDLDHHRSPTTLYLNQDQINMSHLSST